MKTIYNPARSEWETLCRRPNFLADEIDGTVKNIMREVRQNGDTALVDFALRFDKVALSSIRVAQSEIRECETLVSQTLKNAISVAAKNIETFHASQSQNHTHIETMPGVVCWRKNTPIQHVGLYIPGGSAPLFSTVLMLGIPAKIAGCKRIVLCTPCNADEKINPAILYTANFLGITEIYKIGGAQAIAAMAYGTQSIAKVDKIFGPGNRFVSKAKELAQSEGIAIDLPAGPSEVLVIADKNAPPDFVAADLLAQAEHGADSQVVLLTDNADTVENVKLSLQKQLKELPRNEIAKKALDNSFCVFLGNMDECVAFSNEYAPEHLILAINEAEKYSDAITNAGSVFLGNYTPESAGDYASGTNHTLPTNAYAKSYSGVSLDSFLKKITFQHITKQGLQNIGQTVEVMAEAEQLQAHKNAVTVRLNSINNEQ